MRRIKKLEKREMSNDKKYQQKKRKMACKCDNNITTNKKK